MYYFDVPGPPMAPLASAYGLRVSTGGMDNFNASELAILNRPLPHEGGAVFPRSGLAMANAYSLTFDLSGYWLPPVETDIQGYFVEPIVFFTSGNLAELRSLGLAYDPVPSGTTMNTRVRSSRLISGVEITGSGDLATGSVTLPQEFQVVRLGARVYGWRSTWLECEWDA